MGAMDRPSSSFRFQKERAEGRLGSFAEGATEGLQGCVKGDHKGAPPLAAVSRPSTLLSWLLRWAAGVEGQTPARQGKAGPPPEQGLAGCLRSQDGAGRPGLGRPEDGKAAGNLEPAEAPFGQAAPACRPSCWVGGTCQPGPWKRQQPEAAGGQLVWESWDCAEGRSLAPTSVTLSAGRGVPLCQNP